MGVTSYHVKTVRGYSLGLAGNNNVAKAYRTGRKAVRSAVNKAGGSGAHKAIRDSFQAERRSASKARRRARGGRVYRRQANGRFA